MSIMHHEEKKYRGECCIWNILINVEYDGVFLVKQDAETPPEGARELRGIHTPQVTDNGLHLWFFLSQRKKKLFMPHPIMRQEVGRERKREGEGERWRDQKHTVRKMSCSSLRGGMYSRIRRIMKRRGKKGKRTGTKEALKGKGIITFPTSPPCADPTLWGKGEALKGKTSSPAPLEGQISAHPPHFTGGRAESAHGGGFVDADTTCIATRTGRPSMGTKGLEGQDGIGEMRST